jgi:hypothetical protein
VPPRGRSRSDPLELRLEIATQDRREASDLSPECRRGHRAGLAEPADPGAVSVHRPRAPDLASHRDDRRHPIGVRGPTSGRDDVTVAGPRAKDVSVEAGSSRSAVAGLADSSPPRSSARTYARSPLDVEIRDACPPGTRGAGSRERHAAIPTGP